MISVATAGGVGGLLAPVAAVEHGFDVLPREEEVVGRVRVGEQEVATPCVEVCSVWMAVLGDWVATTRLCDAVAVEDELVGREENLEREGEE